jgi:hypothetical protein
MEPLFPEDARRMVEGYIEHYNNVHLNSAVGHISPNLETAQNIVRFLGSRLRDTHIASNRPEARHRVATRTAFHRGGVCMHRAERLAQFAPQTRCRSVQPDRNRAVAEPSANNKRPDTIQIWRCKKVYALATGETDRRM